LYNHDHDDVDTGRKLLTVIRIHVFSITTPSIGIHSDQNKKTKSQISMYDSGWGMYFFMKLQVALPSLARIPSSFGSEKKLGKLTPMYIKRIKAVEILARLFVHHVAAIKGKQTAINLSKVMQRTTQFEVPWELVDRNKYGGQKYFPIEMKNSGYHMRRVL
jgi:hypothetical protein